MFMLYLFFLAVFHGATSEDPCIPDRVEDLWLDLNYTLWWQASTNCENTTYLIYVTSVNEGELFIWDTVDPFLLVAHLPMCELFWFRVVAVSNDVSSASNLMVAQVPAEPGTNVTVTEIHASPQSENSVFLEWKLDPEFAHCVQNFRVVRWDGESEPVDVYSYFDNIVFDDLPACTRFEFTVKPIYNNDAEGGVAQLMYDTPAHNLQLPTLLNVRPGSMFVDMTWELAPYQTNRCTITSIVVDGSPHVNLTIPISDSATRPLIPIHIESLQPDRMYLFRVSVVNTAGPSQPVTIGIQTLPEAEVSN